MDLLGDPHEVIRNEALLLLTGLTRASADIQKIAAFQGAFDRILHVLECAFLHSGCYRQLLADLVPPMCLLGTVCVASSCQCTMRIFFADVVGTFRPDPVGA